MPIISVKDNILDAAEYGLGQITVANGYNNTVREIHDPPIEANAMKEFPAFNVFEGEDLCENALGNLHEQTGGNQCKLFNSLILELDGYLNVVETPRKARNKLLADVQKYFGLHWNIPDINGTASAFNCMYLSSVPFGVEVNKPLVGITIRLRVWYDQKLTDPTLRG
jgi:hypothetical protein